MLNRYLLPKSNNCTKYKYEKSTNIIWLILKFLAKTTGNIKTNSSKYKYLDMTKTLIAFCLFLTINSNAQKITSNDVDKFTGERNVQTNYVLLNGSVQARLKTVDADTYLVLNGAYGSVIGSDARVIFLLDDGSQVAAYSTGIQTPTYSVGMSAYTYYYRLPAASLSALKSKQVRSVRRDEFADIEVKEKHALKFQKLCQLLP